jgi:hypothetical protein
MRHAVSNRIDDQHAASHVCTCNIYHTHTHPLFSVCTLAPPKPYDKQRVNNNS